MTKLSLAHIGLGDFPPLAIEYARYMKSIAMRSELTVCEYLLDLRIFFRYTVANDSGIDYENEPINDLDFSKIDIDRIKQMDTDFLLGFIYYLDSVRDNDSNAKLRKISALRSFFGYLCKKKHLLDHNPASELDGPRKKSSPPKFLNLDESRELLCAVTADIESKSRRRDYAIITIFLNCGLRLSELCGIDLGDIDSNWGYMFVTGKGNKKRQVFLNDACREALYPYLKQRLDQNPDKQGTDALFLSGRNKRISNKTVQAMVYKYLDAAGLGGRGLSVHKLRHTAATLMYQQGGVDVRVLQELLGHSQLNTTQIYTHVNNQSVRDAIYSNPLNHTKEDSKDK